MERGKGKAVRWLDQLRARLWPRVPDVVRDELTLVRYHSLRAQVPPLYLMLALLITATVYGSPIPEGSLIAWGLPIIILVWIVIRLSIWYRQRAEVVTQARARRMIWSMTFSSSTVGAMISIWCVSQWLRSAPDVALYYPIMLSLGALSTAYCVSNIRFATMLVLSFCLGPISFLMMFAGSALDAAAGASILTACLFLMRLIHQQHSRLIAQLLLEQQMRALAHTDELTGLLNRRALHAEFARLADAGEPLSLILLDLDGFKSVNDRHGHAAGDAVLIEMARRMRTVCDDAAHIARLGGDEFAVLLPGGTAKDAQSIADRILNSLVHPIDLACAKVRIGASAGMAAATVGEVNVHRLLATADDALYAAKRGQRRRARAPQAAVKLAS